MGGWGAITQGAGAGSKPYFLTAGHRAWNDPFTLPTDSSRVSPDVGYMPALGSNMVAPLCGGSMRLMVRGVSPVTEDLSVSLNPAGSADASSGRTTVSATVAATMRGGRQYRLGVICDSGGVGFMRDTGSGGLAEYDNSGNLVSVWSPASVGQFTMYYNVLPSKPLNVVLSLPGAPGTVRANWDVPASDGGTAVNGYKLEWSTDVFATILGSVNDTGSLTRQYDVAGVTLGQTLSFRVGARNLVGDDAGSTVASVRSDVVSILVPTSGPKVFKGSAFQQAATKEWDGSTFRRLAFKEWDGAVWRPLH